MLTIKPINLRSLSNAEAYGFFCGTREALKDAFKTIPEYAVQFIEAMTAFDAAMNSKTAGISGQELDNLDTKVDTLWANIRTYLRVMANHPDGCIATASDTCLTIFEGIEDPTRKPYATQYPLMHRLIESLEALPTETLTTCQLTLWLTALKTAVSDFTTLYELRTEEKAQRTFGIVKTARQNAFDAHRLMARAINVQLELAETPEAIAFTKNLNTRIDTQQAILKARKTAATKKDSSSNED